MAPASTRNNPPPGDQSGPSDQSENQGFSAVQMQQLQQLMANMRAEIISEISVKSSSSEPTEKPTEKPPPDDLTKPESTPVAKTTKASDIGFFDPEHQDGVSLGAVATAGKHVIYRDVYVFVDRLKDLANTKPHTYLSVKNTISSCLRGSALMWYTNELTDLEKTLLRSTDLDKWYTTLIDRFKAKTPVAMAYLTSSTYSFNEVRNNIPPRVWIQEMLHFARAADMTHTINQLTIIWNRLHAHLRRDIPMPTASTTLGQFLQQIDEKTPIWIDLAANRPQQIQQGQRYQQTSSQPSGQSYQQRQILPPSPSANHSSSSSGKQVYTEHPRRYFKPLPYQGDTKGLHPRLPVNGGKSHAYLIDVTEYEGFDHAVGLYEDEDIDTTL